MARHPSGHGRHPARPPRLPLGQPGDREFDARRADFGDALPPLPVEEETDEETSGRPDVRAVGDPELLADFGTPGDVLVQLCAEEGALPSDVVATVCERAGCLEQLDALRGA